MTVWVLLQEANGATIGGEPNQWVHAVYGTEAAATEARAELVAEAKAAERWVYGEPECEDEAEWDDDFHVTPIEVIDPQPMCPACAAVMVPKDFARWDCPNGHSALMVKTERIEDREGRL